MSPEEAKAVLTKMLAARTPHRVEFLPGGMVSITADEWLPMASAPKDGTPLLLLCKDPVREGREDLWGWGGKIIVAHNRSNLATDDFDPGWSMSAPVGHGGFPDEWFVGWQLLPAKPPAVTSGTDAPGEPQAENQSPTVREGAGHGH